MSARNLRPDVEPVTRRAPGRPPDGSVAKTKTTISIDTELYEAVISHVGPGKKFGSFSQVVGEAVEEFARARRLLR